MLLLSNINFIVGCILVGLIWTIQVVHYPLFKNISEDKFIENMQAHQSKISLLVVPLMSIELFSSVFLLFLNSTEQLHKYYLLGFCFIIVIWLLTYFVHMPQHKKLLLGYNEKIINQLILTNWFRTSLWSLKLIVMYRAQNLIN